MEEMQPQNRLNRQKKERFLPIVLTIAVTLSLIIGFLSGYLMSRRSHEEINNSPSLFNEVYETLNKEWLDPNEQDLDLEQASIQGLLQQIKDPYSSYLSTQEWGDFTTSVDGSYVGIGVAFKLIDQGGLITQVTEGGPAQGAGLVAGDIITHVDGKSVEGMTTTQIGDLVKGEENTKVKITYLHDGKTKSVEIERKTLDSSCIYDIREENGKRFGYIRLSTFGSLTANHMENALKYFKDENVQSLVLDLRGNTGGYVSAAQGILNLLVPKGAVLFQIEEKNHEPISYLSDIDTFYSFNHSYILVDELSASASELVAGCLQEVMKYQLIGETTYGKGVAQTSKVLSDLSVLKYTYARWLLPSGKCIQNEGLTPDIYVESVDTSGITTLSLTQDIAYDSVNPLTISLQRMLNMIGYGTIREDGYFDKATENALKRFERDHQLKVDGIYSNDDHDQIVVQVLLFLAKEEQDYIYQKLLEVME